MRIGGFLLGSMVGAATIVYLSKNNKSIMSTSAWNQVADSINTLVGTARNKMMNNDNKMS